MCIRDRGSEVIRSLLLALIQLLDPRSGAGCWIVQSKVSDHHSASLPSQSIMSALQPSILTPSSSAIACLIALTKSDRLDLFIGGRGSLGKTAWTLNFTFLEDHTPKISQANSRQWGGLVAHWISPRLWMTGHQTIFTVTVSDWAEWRPTLSTALGLSILLINSHSL
mgnify:CR=1 FL=1